ncbi:mercuric reductase [Siphonobacter sp. SORGH_AS_0500]|uniref:mercuric reductase n=1 Tax=Siphonobacter sp. SORGH_AS_0500 TaxID=1864824 RepID=UPI002863618E|nr:mercuric reductase [Siphonobacter sp. SORGH_AS_0500]MDR6198001.1 dihydrolipoamide dehydrogenase [Siphonobacter sp. SORGH_AS_0500]
MKKYDIIIIGAGQAGVPLAMKYAKAGQKTVLIEKELVGGSCVNYGCTPTKTMIASAQLAYKVAHGAEMGIDISGYQVNMTKIRDRKEEVVTMKRSASEEKLEELENLDLIYGNAKFTGDKTLVVRGKSGKEEALTADLIFINTGTRPSIPDVEGLSEVDYLTNKSILELTEVPDHLLIIGGGYIGMEFGQMFRRFGSEVTIVESSERLLSKEDEDVVNALESILTDEGITILKGYKLEAISKKDASIEASLASDSGEKKVSASHVLIAVGREPNSLDLGLESTGIKVDEKGYIQVNETLETSVSGIYALGEANGGPAFTHIAYDDYRIVSENLLNQGNRSTSDRPFPYCMFTDPQLGRVGLTEQEARKKGLAIQIAKMEAKSVARSQEVGETCGLWKVVLEKETGKILGAAILSSEGGEIMSFLEIAMMGNLTYEQLQNGVFAHPTYAESLNNLFTKLEE